MTATHILPSSEVTLLPANQANIKIHPPHSSQAQRVRVHTGPFNPYANVIGHVFTGNEPRLDIHHSVVE